MAASNDNTPSPSCQQEKESLVNDALTESNACKNVMKGNTFSLQPVPPYASGEGFPYAPEGWPNPGDIWGWKVGRRTNRAGYYHDRYLYLPRSLQQPSRKKMCLQSKPEVIRYVESNFPNMGIEAFFALFNWPVPSTELSPTKALQSLSTPPIKSLGTGNDTIEEITIRGKLKRKAQLSYRPTRKSTRLINVHRHSRPVIQDGNDIIDLSYLNEDAKTESSEDLKGTSDSESDQPASNINGQPENSSVAAGNLIDSKEESAMQAAPDKSTSVTIAENFDDYLNTLEDILVLPHTETSSSNPVVAPTTQENEMTECRKKLSSLLALDFPSLISSDNVAEVSKLASQLQKDPSLSVDQLIKLKLVEEIPLVSEAFQEAKVNIEEAEKLFAELEAKKLKVPCLKKEYNELKDKLGQIQAEIDTRSVAMQEIDDKILQLEAKRTEMSNALETLHKKKAEVSSSQTLLANSIPTIVSEIQHGHSEKPKWELKKANCAQRVAEINERFNTLRGFTFSSNSCGGYYFS